MDIYEAIEHDRKEEKRLLRNMEATAVGLILKLKQNSYLTKDKYIEWETVIDYRKGITKRFKKENSFYNLNYIKPIKLWWLYLKNRIAIWN